MEKNTGNKPVTLNLTKQEAECLKHVFNEWAGSYWMNTKDAKPCKPFLDKLKAKLQ